MLCYAIDVVSLLAARDVYGRAPVLQESMMVS